MNQAQVLKEKLMANGITGLALDIDETLAWTIGYWVEQMQKKFGNPEGLSIHEVIAKYRYTQMYLTGKPKKQLHGWMSTETQMRSKRCCL